MRQPRPRLREGAFYHCMSRSLDKWVIFPEGRSEEREFFLGLMRKLESFTGVHVISYTLSLHHYSIVCEVPEPVQLSDEELLDRIEKLSGTAVRESVAKALRYWTHQRNLPEEAQKIRQRYLVRMFDLSIFNKELKGRYSQWFNRRHNRVGHLWAERFVSIKVL
jgi:hypothetical protein